MSGADGKRFFFLPLRMARRLKAIGRGLDFNKFFKSDFPWRAIFYLSDEFYVTMFCKVIIFLRDNKGLVLSSIKGWDNYAPKTTYWPCHWTASKFPNISNPLQEKDIFSSPFQLSPNPQQITSKKAGRKWKNCFLNFLNILCMLCEHSQASRASSPSDVCE